ncbi:hypothetical protein CHUAL_002739 [Chamberlinius hualienensis]
MDRRYHNLRRKLDQHGYKQRLDVESIDLVEKLYIDLLQAKNIKHTPITSSSLAKENSELQKDISRLKIDHETQLKAAQNHIHELENEISEYKLLNNQHIQRIKLLEDENKQNFNRENDNINQIQEVNRKTKLDKQNSVSRLNLDKDSLKLQLDHANELISHLKQQKDKQSKILQNERGIGDFGNPCSDHLVAHLTFEMEHLQRLNFELENKLKDVITVEKESRWNERRQLVDQNKQLESNLVHVDKMADEIRKQKDQLVATADKEMNEAQEEIKSLRSKMENQKKDISNLRTENEILFKEKSELQSTLSSVNSQIKKYEDLIKKLEEENKHSSSINTEKTEDNRIKKSIDISNWENVIKSIEKQRDFFKSQIEQLSNRSENDTNGGKVTSTPYSDNRPIRMKEEKFEIQWNPLISFLEDERDAYKQENILLRNTQRKENIQPQVLTDLKLKLHKVTEENKELNKTLESLEKHIEEVNGSADDLAAEKANLQKLYDKVLTAHEHQKEKQGQNLISTTIRDVIARTQAERDKALANSQRAQMELDILHNKLKLATEAQMLERKRLEDKISELELQQLQGNERAELLSKLTSIEVQLFSLTEDNDALKNRILELQKYSVEDKSKVEQLQRELAEKSEKAEKILTQKSSEKNLIADKVKSLSREIDDLKNLIDRRDAEIRQLKMSILMLDKDKDKFQTDIDEKTEQVISLTDTINSKIKEEMDLKLKVANLETHLDRMADDVMIKDREISNLKRDLEYKKRELEEVKKQCDELNLKQIRLNDEILVITRDNQMLEKEVKSCQAEKEILKREIQDYVNEVSRVEQLLRAQEEERNDVLEQFKNLSETTSSLEYQNNNLELQANNSKMELLAKQAEIIHSNEIISSLNQEIKQHFTRQQSCEIELRNVQRRLDDVQMKLSDKTQENDRILRDVTALRELNVKLSSDKDNLSKDIRNNEKERVLLENRLSEAKHQFESNKIQLNAEKTAVKSLEQLLANNRQKDYQTQLSNRELTDELAILKEKLRQADLKL